MAGSLHSKMCVFVSRYEVKEKHCSTAMSQKHQKRKQMYFGPSSCENCEDRNSICCTASATGLLEEQTQISAVLNPLVLMLTLLLQGCQGGQISGWELGYEGR